MIEPMYNLSTDDVIKLFNKFSLIMTAYMTDASNRTGLMNGTLRNNSREITDDDMYYFDNNTKPLYKFDIVLSTIKVNLSIINRDSSLCYTKDAYFTDQVSELIMYVYIPDTKYDTFCTFCDIFGNIFDSTTYGVHEASNIISILFSGVLCDISIDDISKCIEENYTDLEDDEIYTKLYNYIHEILKNDITDNNTIQLAKLDTVIKAIRDLD